MFSNDQSSPVSIGGHMKIAVLALCVALSALPDATSQTTASQDHVRWVESSLHEMKAVKVGATRSEVEKLFVAEGGMSTVSQKTYSFRTFPYFKVDVEFIAEPGNPAGGSPDDKVIKISRPYLDWPRGD
jgi:hypothetical protein